MTKLAIIGSTGFLGKYFLKEYGSDFSQINLLSRTTVPSYETYTWRTVKGSLGNRESIKRLLEGMDVLVHAGFDHAYSENIPGIQHILYSLSSPENTIKRVIYLSSYVVYNRDECFITEESLPSHYCDIYTREKQLTEAIIRKAVTPVDFIILQPTIVLGQGGNWSRVLVEAAKSKVVKLSNEGTTTCNFVHVKDVAQAIDRSIKISSKRLPARITSFLITGGMAPWKDILKIHVPNVSQGNHQDGNTTHVKGTYNGNYGNSFFQNSLIGILYTPGLHILTHPILKYAKYRMERVKSGHQSSLPNKAYSFKGLSKSIQQTNHQVDYKKARLILGYEASCRFPEIAVAIR